MTSGRTDSTALAQRIHAVLPQTQCTRCGYLDCAAYAHAIAHAQAPINQCPPGGAQGIAQISALTGQAVIPLNPDYGSESPRSVALIDEQWCIGCTLCLDACPVDAIVGSNKRMHTVIEAECTGCALCLPVCPVDCIALENASAVGSDTSSTLQTWSAAQAHNALQRYTQRKQRLERTAQEAQAQREQKAAAKLADLAAHSRLTDTQALDKKRQIIEAALARARAQRQHAP